MLGTDLDRSTMGLVGAIAGFIGLVAIGGLPGAIAGLAVLACWFVVGDLAAFSLAIVALGALAAEPVLFAEDTPILTTELVGVALVTVALAPLLLGRVLRTDASIAVGALVLVLWFGFATVSIVPVAAGESTLVAAAVLVGVFAAISYGLHRYGLLVSGVLQHG